MLKFIEWEKYSDLGGNWDSGFFFFFNFYFLLLDRSSDLDDGVYGELYMIGCRDLCNSSL